MIGKILRWLAAYIVCDVPESLDVCEACRVVDCTVSHAENCRLYQISINSRRAAK